MARLFHNEKQVITDNLYELICKHRHGLRESEIEQITQLERRRINNYLRELRATNRIYKEGWEWFASYESTPSKAGPR